jgi:hypothetical protein
MERFVCPNDLESYTGRSVKYPKGPPGPDRSKGRSQTKRSPWYSRQGVGCEANDPALEKFTVTKSPDHGGGQDPHRVVMPVRKMIKICSFK